MIWSATSHRAAREILIKHVGKFEKLFDLNTPTSNSWRLFHELAAVLEFSVKLGIITQAESKQYHESAIQLAGLCE